MGTEAVSDLGTSTTIGETFVSVPAQLMDVSKFWRKSVFCALIAGKIAKYCGIDAAERFFIEGLLRDIGHFILYQTVPQRAQSALIVADYLDSSLAEVGAELIRSWGMPVQIEVVASYKLTRP